MRSRMSHPLTYMEYLKEEAKRAFQNERYHLALQKYEEALQIYLAPKFGFPKHGRDLAQLFSNMANVFIKIRSHEKATQASVASINADPQWIKGYYFLAVALKSKQEYYRALQALLDGLRICTFDDDCLSDVVAELFSVTEDAQNNRSQAKTHYKTVMKELEDMGFQGQVWEKIVSRMSKRGLWKALYILVCTPDPFSNCRCLPLRLNLPQVSLEKLFKVGKPQDLWIHTLSCALIFFGAKVSTIGPFPAHTVLPFAIKSRDFFVLKTVFDTTTTSINLQNKCGETLMHIVAKTKYDENDIQAEDVRMLLNLHADPCIADIYGKLPKEYLGKNIEALKLIERYLKQASVRKQQPTDTNSQKSATHYADVDARKHHGTTAGAWKPQATSTDAHRPEATSTDARKPQAAGADARKMQATDARKSQATAADARKSQAAGANAPKPQVPEKMHPVEVTSEKSTTPNTHKQEEVLEKSGTRQISEQVDPLTEALQRFASVSKRKKKPTKLIDHQDVLPFLTYAAQYEELSASVRCDVPVAFWRRLLNELLNVYRWQECLFLLRGGGNGRQVRKGGLASCVNLENLDIGAVVEQMLQGSVQIPMVKLVKVLLEQGSVSKGAEHLKHCMEKGEYALASLLLEHGADNDGLVLNPGDTPPHVALSIALGKRDDYGIHMLKFLLQEHWYVNIQDKNGNTLLHLFFQFPLCRLHSDAIKVLSDYPIDLSFRNNEGRDAFWGVKENDPRKKMWKAVAPKQFPKKKTKKKQDVATPPRGSANARGELTTHSSLTEPQPNCDPESDQVGKVTEMPLPKNISFKQALVTDIKNLILDIDPAMIQAMRAMRQDSMQKSVGISPQSPEAETFQKFQLSAAQASSDLSEEDNDELVNGEANLANSFGSEDYDDFDRLTWEIECTRDVLRTLNDKLLPPETKNKILRIIHFLGSGDWSKHRIKRVKGIADKSDIKLYEAKIDKAQRILWEIAVDFSPRLSDVPEKIIEAEESSTGDQKVGKVYSEIIRIWDIALAHKDINHIIKKIVSSYNRGIGCMLRRKLKGIDRVKFSSVNAVQQRFPLCYMESNDASQTNVEKAPEYIPPASSIENEYNIMKFHTFSTAVALNILQSHETGSHVEYPFRVGELEHAVINLNPKPAEAIILVGRSGTGKTTCLVYRLWKVFLSYWERAMQAGDPWIYKPVSSMRVSSLEDAQADEENVMKEQGGSEQEVPCSSKHLQNDDCETNTVASEDSCEAVEMYEHLHQLFITKNHVLCCEVKRNFTELFKSSGLSCQFTPLDANVHRLQEVKDENFPLFLTSRQFLLLLDASLPQPFFPRNEDGSLKKTIKGWLVEESDVILDDEDLDDPEFDESSTEFAKEDKKEDSRKLVTYETFTCDIWPAMIKGKQMCNPSLVWMEIKSFLKGSVEALNSPRGYLNLAEYKEMGQKRAPNFSGDRDEIFQLFENYLHVKSQWGYFDEEDLVFHIYSRLNKLENLPWSIHQVYGDEIQDFTQAELSLLMNSNNDPNMMFLTGDTAQCIMRGISFRFNDLCSLFYYAANAKVGSSRVHNVRVPHRIYQLSQNYRSHSGILNLGSSVVDLLIEFFPSSFDRLPPDRGLFHGPRPAILDLCSSEDLAILLRGNRRESQPIEFGAHQVILVANDKAKERLPEELSLGLVLTIYESKGLEFDDVLLYNFFSDSESVKEWRVVSSYKPEDVHDSRSENVTEIKMDDLVTKSRPLEFDAVSHKALNSDLKQLYTAITRARVNLWIFDDNEEKRAPVFEYFIRCGLVSVIRAKKEDGVLDDNLFAKSSSVEEWNTQGDYFFKHRRWKVAAKCYHKGENSMKEKLALAHNTVLQLRPEKGNQKNAQQYLSLTKTYLECGMPQLGLKCLQNAKEFMLCAELCERMGKFQEAVNWYSKAQCFDKAAQVVERNPSASALSVENWRLRAAAAHLHADRESDALNSLSSLPPETQIRFLKSYKRFGPAGNLLIKMGRRNEAAALFRDNGQLAQAAEAAEPKSQMAAECLLGDVRVHMHLALAHSEDVDQQFQLLLMRVESGLVDICKEVHVPLIQAEAHFLLGQLQSDAEALKLAYHLFDKLGHIMGKVEALAAFLDCGQGGPDCVAWLLDALEGLLNVIVAFCSKFGGSQLTDAQTQDINHCHVFYGIHEESNEYRILKYEGSRFQKLWFDLNDGSTNHFAASKVSLQKAREILRAHMLKLLKYLVYKVRDFSQQNSIEICSSLILGLACQQEGCKKLHRQISKHDIDELVFTKINDIHLLGILLEAEAKLKSDDLDAVTDLMPKQKFEACEGLLSLLFPKHFHLRHLSENRKSFSILLGKIRNGSYFALVITKYMKDCVEKCSDKEKRESSDMWIKVFCASKLLSKTKEHLELLHQEEEHFIVMKNKSKSDVLPGKKGMIMNAGHCICFFRLFVDSMSYFQNRELADSMHNFYRFLKLIKDRQSVNHSLLPSMGNLVMLLEFQFLLTFALFMRVKHQVICLPRSYLTILNLWELLVNVNLTNRKNAINTYAAKKGVESRLTNHLQFLVDSLSSCLPRTFSKECLMSGEMERAVVLCLVVLVNSGIVSKIDIPIRLYLSELKVKLESLFADVPSRLMACVGAVNSAKRPIDVVNILEGLLKQRDDEFVQDFSWENSHYRQNCIIFQRVYHNRFGERAFSALENLNEETSFQEQKMADEHEYFENAVEEVILQRQRNQKRKKATQIRWRKAFRKVVLCLRMSSHLRVAARNTSFMPAVVNNKRCEICGVVFRKYVTEEEEQQQQTEDEPDVSEELDMPEHEDATTTKGHCNLENHMQRVIEYSDYRAFFQHSVDPVLWQAKEVKNNLKLATLDPLQQERKKLSELEKDITDTAEFIWKTRNWQAGNGLLLTKAKELENLLEHVKNMQVNGMLSREMPSTVAPEPEDIEDDHATFEEIQPQTFRNKKCRKYRQRVRRR